MTDIEEIKAMIDPTSFNTVVAHLDKDPEIQWVVLVHEGVDLAEVGRICVDGESKEFACLMQERKIQFVCHEQGTVAFPVLMVTEIPFNEMVRVFYVPPIYLMQRTGKEWR
jgi:hypothetical protein